jgi:hypothetical protein
MRPSLTIAPTGSFLSNVVEVHLDDEFEPVIGGHVGSAL